jgi:hypothetical protein
MYDPSFRKTNKPCKRLISWAKAEKPKKRYILSRNSYLWLVKTSKIKDKRDLRDKIIDEGYLWALDWYQKNEIS